MKIGVYNDEKLTFDFVYRWSVNYLFVWFIHHFYKIVCIWSILFVSIFVFQTDHIILLLPVIKGLPVSGQIWFSQSSLQVKPFIYIQCVLYLFLYLHLFCIFKNHLCSSISSLVYKNQFSENPKSYRSNWWTDCQKS